MSKRRGDSYGEIVRRATEYMQANFSQPVFIDEVAKAAFYSPVQLRRAFRKVTGQSVLVYLNGLRLERARQMLRDTDLSIAEISLSTGFSDPAYFATAFKRLAGLTPMQFRAGSRENSAAEKTSASGKEIAEVFRDPLGGTFSPFWLPRLGEWKNETDFAEGLANEICELACTRRLPENFRLGFDFQFVLSKEFPPTDLIIKLLNEPLETTYVQIIVGAHDNTIGKMERTGIGVTCNTKARIRPGTWQRVEIELNDDTLTVRLDEQEVFSYRDPFPGGYASRSKISIGSWKSIVRFRNFSVVDLGIQPLVWAVRQGDSLFSAGLYGTARDFYLRLLESQASGSNSMELHYKIGMCFMRESAYARAGEWFSKILTRPDHDFWSRAARLAEAELAWESGDRRSFETRITLLSASAHFHNGLRELLSRVLLDLNSRGFYRDAGWICELFAAMEKEEALKIHPQVSRIETLVQLGRLQEAEGLIQEALRQKSVPEELRFICLMTLGEICSRQGKWQDADLNIQKIRAMTKDRTVLARCLVFEAYALRGQEKFEQALSLLDSLSQQIPNAPRHFAVFAQLTASFTFCAIEKTNQARGAIEKARQIDPGDSYLLPGLVGRFQFVPDLLDGNFEAAAEALMRSGQMWPKVICALLLIEAGICYELAGVSLKAQEAFTRVIDNYPANRYCFFGELARHLNRGEYETAFQMPYAFQIRSEVFCLLGMLCEAKGQKDRAQTFFRQSQAEDPTLSWPAAMSKRKLLAGSV